MKNRVLYWGWQALYTVYIHVQNANTLEDVELTTVVFTACSTFARLHEHGVNRAGVGVA